MKTTGIIAEYNPFHQGHIYHIQKTKEITQCDCLVVIVSSFYSQRGLPSFLSRYDKTKLALEYGANLVLELPACFACQSADYFAKYAIQSLSCLDIDTLCFGSETNNISYLKSIVLKNKINPKFNINQNQDLNLCPNDILGFQYIRYCKEYKINPVSIQRNETFKSATQTRIDAYKEQQDFQQYFHLEQNWNHYYPYLRLILQMSKPEDLAQFHLVNEGIEYRLIQASQYKSWNDFLNACVSKTYTKARIQRTCIMILLQIKKEDMPSSFSGCRVLGFDKVGQALLKEKKDKNIYTKFKDLPPFLQEIERKSKALYTTFSQIEDQVILYDRD